MKKLLPICPHCFQDIKQKSERPFTRGHVGIVMKIYKYLVLNNKEKALIKNIPDLSHVQYGTMNRLVVFGLAYKESGWPAGAYGFNRDRLKAFLKGEWAVAKSYICDPIAKTNTLSDERIIVSQVKNFEKIKDEYGDYFVKYISTGNETIQQTLV